MEEPLLIRIRSLLILFLKIMSFRGQCESSLILLLRLKMVLEITLTELYQI